MGSIILIPRRSCLISELVFSVWDNKLLQDYCFRSYENHGLCCWSVYLTAVAAMSQYLNLMMAETRWMQPEMSVMLSSMKKISAGRVGLPDEHSVLTLIWGARRIQMRHTCSKVGT